MSTENIVENAEMVDWFDDYAVEEGEDLQIDQYDLNASPNDFNIQTRFNFIESDAVKIPGFQRYFIRDIKRAHKHPLTSPYPSAFSK